MLSVCNSHFAMNVHARWRENSMDRDRIGWAKSLFEATKPHAIGTAYINFMRRMRQTASKPPMA
jgi:hypothetical protein